MPALRSPMTTLTFDFWNTLFSADGGTWTEVGPRRIQALREMLEAAGLRPPAEELDRVYRSGFDVYMAAWESGRHFGAVQEVQYFLEQFQVATERIDEGVISRAVRGVEEAAKVGSLPLVAGVADTIPRLAAEGYKLAVISDTSLTPGRVLKEFMERDGLLGHFATLTFSDETGFTKPDRRMFTRTLSALGSGPDEAAHVGDTPRTDIAGAKAVGMVTIRCAGVNDHPESPEADYVIKDHREIPGILDSLG